MVLSIFLDTVVDFFFVVKTLAINSIGLKFLKSTEWLRIPEKGIIYVGGFKMEWRMDITGLTLYP